MPNSIWICCASTAKSEVHGNAYRRPKKYQLLIDGQINEPFIRSDRRE